ncbi:hypothetical protein F5141DRAFT_1201478 [Pisolithus sp. B1]|nr:hypothetical protein F5141DRAFT_1201478 [Pisolithus sp. B1]
MTLRRLPTYSRKRCHSGDRCPVIRLILPQYPSITAPSTTCNKFVVISLHTSYSNDMGIPGGFGCTLIAGLISAMLYGLTLLQGRVEWDFRLTYVYYMHYSEDTLTVQLLVAATCILDTLHVSFVCHMLYHYLITNYGVPSSLEYIVWFVCITSENRFRLMKYVRSWPASVIVNLLAILAVQFFFAYKIHYLCPPKVRWLVTAPILLFVVAHFVFGIVTVVVTFIDTNTNVLAQTWYYSVTPSAATVTVAEVLITVSLCVLLYDGGSHAAFPRTKRLVNTLIIYAANRCLLTLLVVIGELAANVDQQASWTMGLNFIVGTPSLNTREYLWSQGSTAASTTIVSALHFAIPPMVSENVGSSKDGGRRSSVREVADTDATTEPAFEKTTMLRRDRPHAFSFSGLRCYDLAEISPPTRPCSSVHAIAKIRFLVPSTIAYCWNKPLSGQMHFFHHDTLRTGCEVADTAFGAAGHDKHSGYGTGCARSPSMWSGEGLRRSGKTESEHPLAIRKLSLCTVIPQVEQRRKALRRHICSWVYDSLWASANRWKRVYRCGLDSLLTFEEEFAAGVDWLDPAMVSDSHHFGRMNVRGKIRNLKTWMEKRGRRARQISFQNQQILKTAKAMEADAPWKKSSYRHNLWVKEGSSRR